MAAWSFELSMGFSALFLALIIMPSGWQGSRKSLNAGKVAREKGIDGMHRRQVYLRRIK